MLLKQSYKKNPEIKIARKIISVKYVLRAMVVSLLSGLLSGYFKYMAGVCPGGEEG